MIKSEAESMTNVHEREGQLQGKVMIRVRVRIRAKFFGKLIMIVVLEAFVTKLPLLLLSGLLGRGVVVVVIVVVVGRVVDVAVVEVNSSPGTTTVMVPNMDACTAQKYGYCPGEENNSWKLEPATGLP